MLACPASGNGNPLSTLRGLFVGNGRDRMEKCTSKREAISNTATKTPINMTSMS